jgi:dihydropteroate synthase
MHNRGHSTEMYRLAEYKDVIEEVARELGDRVSHAIAAGIARDRLIIDPGLGFAKRAGQTFEALARLPELTALGLPILTGPSRKSYLKAALGDVQADQRLWGTAAAVAASVLGGAHIVRVHDVGEMVQVARVADAIRKAGETPAQS